MKYPNAYKGVNRIFIAEIISIIAAIFAIIGVTMLLAGVTGVDLNVSAELPMNGLTVGGSIFTIVTAVLSVVSFIMYIIGVVNASKDESSFKTALYAILVGIIAGLVGGIFSGNLVIYGLASVVSKFCELIALFFCIGGIGNLAVSLQNEEIANKATTLVKFICAVIIIGIIISVIVTFVPIPATLASILSIVSSVCSIISYIMYLFLLSGAKNMLSA